MGISIGFPALLQAPGRGEFIWAELCQYKGLGRVMRREGIPELEVGSRLS